MLTINQPWVHDLSNIVLQESSPILDFLLSSILYVDFSFEILL